MLLMISTNKMWTFILFYILGLNIFQCAGQDNSTQMYYVKLTIENSAIGNLTELLKPFVSNTSLKVDDIEKTTICKSFSASKECTCKSNYRWSDKVCSSNQNCCGKKTCIFPKNSSSMCVSTTTVNVKGVISLKGLQYQGCLAEKNSPSFLECHDDVLERIKSVYSTLMGFDVAMVNSYSIGSIIANFEMTIAHKVMAQDLIDKSILLMEMLKATLKLETTGVVLISMPHNPVSYNSQHDLTCTLQEDLKVPPTWKLTRKDSVYDITNGTGSQLTSEPKKAKVALTDISEVWAGVYTCAYHQKSESYSITHKASAVMDVCLQPNIDITTSPGFPHCVKQSDLLNVRVNCEIERSTEEYNVTWTGQHIIAELKPLNVSSYSDRTDVYAAHTVVPCNTPMLKPQLTCTFSNRCKQERSASIDVNVIHENEPFCEAELDWETTKAGFTAVQKCKNAAGKRERKCETGSSQQSKPRWNPVYSMCVNQNVDNVLQMATIVDIGIGSLDENAAKVFSLLENVTRDTQAINTFPNINTSIYVLFTLSQKQNLQPKNIAINDFLDSSSNMLDNSLQDSWKTVADEGNLSVAERYLSSVEQLVQRANIVGINKKENVEVATQNCSQGSHCTNTVFNVTIILDSPDPSSVKSTGFKKLERLLPYHDDKYKPNSIVVSTTIERKQSVEIKVKIKFPLLKSRPRNVKMKCVSWDNNTRTWSSDGCHWEKLSVLSKEEEQCVCTHLSSFAILMSKYPLEVPGITEITYVGLSISVISLIISLVIELTVWSIVVKTNTSYLRHTAHVNISLCLLVADCCFLASSNPQNISEIWCKTFVVLKHFCYLSMFFWMLCLSTTLLHQAVFLFHNVSKKNYLRFSLVLGYVCPFLIVAITFLANNGGAEGMYFSSETCWLIYTGILKGSIHTFLIPVGIIVFVNMFSMLVVIMKLLNHPMTGENSQEKERKAAITVMRSVILLTPIFGVTWMFGFVVTLIELTYGPIVYIVNYAFILLNAFQGLFILLSTCLGDPLIREALVKRLKIIAPASTYYSSTNLDSTWKK